MANVLMYHRTAFALRTPLPLSPQVKPIHSSQWLKQFRQYNEHASVEEAEDDDPDDANVSDEESLDQLEPANASNDEAEHQEEGKQYNYDAHEAAGEGNQAEGV